MPKEKPPSKSPKKPPRPRPASNIKTPKSSPKKSASTPRKKSPPKAKSAAPAKPALLAVLPNVALAAFTANGQALLLARRTQKTLSLFDIDSQSETPPLKTLPTFSAAALSTDSRFLAIGTVTGIIAAQSTQTGKLLWKTAKPPDPAPISEITFTHDGSLVIAAGPAWLRILDAKTGQPLPPPADGGGFEPIPGAACPHLALSPDGLFLAHSESHSTSALVWHLPTRQVAHFIKLPVRHGPIARLAFGATVRQLFVAQEFSLSTWNGETGQQVFQFDIPGAQSMAVLDHVNILATLRPAGPDAALQLWSAPTGRLRRTIPLADTSFGPLAASPDGLKLALPAGKECYLWDVAKLIP